ncbi:MAG: hypothetical protein LAT57_00205 [Balneolales bacterium]|nr:hypothetical protein [Balneolales bacterium]
MNSTSQKNRPIISSGINELTRAMQLKQIVVIESEKITIAGKEQDVRKAAESLKCIRTAEEVLRQSEDRVESIEKLNQGIL